MILWNDCTTVESFSQDYGEDASLLEFVCAQEYHFLVITQVHCVKAHQHPSVCTSHTYLTMFGVSDCHLLQLPTQANSLQYWHRVHAPHSDLPQTLQVWKGCSYNITSTCSWRRIINDCHMYRSSASIYVL